MKSTIGGGSQERFGTADYRNSDNVKAAKEKIEKLRNRPATLNIKMGNSDLYNTARLTATEIAVFFEKEPDYSYRPRSSFPPIDSLRKIVSYAQSKLNEIQLANLVSKFMQEIDGVNKLWADIETLRTRRMELKFEIPSKEEDDKVSQMRKIIKKIKGNYSG